MSRPVPSDIAGLLLKRCECLCALDNQPQTKPEMVESLDIPRSTLDDITRDLENADLVEYRDGKWRLTLFGQFAIDQHISYRQGLKSLTETEPLLRELPPETPVDRRLLIDADVYVAEAPIPDEVMQEFLKSVESATHVRRATPIALAGYTDSFYRAATTGINDQLEMILPENTFNRLQKLLPEKISDIVEDENITLYHSNIELEFSLWISDENHAGIIVYGDRGVQGIAINDSNDAINWAIGLYDRIEKSAEPIFYRGGPKVSKAEN